MLQITYTFKNMINNSLIIAVCFCLLGCNSSNSKSGHLPDKAEEMQQFRSHFLAINSDFRTDGICYSVKKEYLQ